VKIIFLFKEKMTKTILFNNNWLPKVEIERLKEMGYTLKIVPSVLTEDQLIKELKGVQGFIVPGASLVTENIIKNSTDLEIIAFSGTGYGKYIDVDAATRYGIPVTYTPGANARSVAEFTLGIAIDLVRKISHYNEISRRGNVIYGETSWILKGRTIGIIGMGYVGSQVAQLAKEGFQMRVIYYSRTRKPALEESLKIEWVKSMKDLLVQADVVTLHPPYTKETIGIISTEEFQAMKENAVLINVARPAMVDPVALKVALDNKMIAGAAMDGYYEEPLPTPENDKYGLLKLATEVLIVTPHIAYQTDDAIRRQTEMFVSSLLAVFEGKKEIPYLINPEYVNYRNKKKGNLSLL
jgi:glyoxylate reductase